MESNYQLLYLDKQIYKKSQKKSSFVYLFLARWTIFYIILVSHSNCLFLYSQKQEEQKQKKKKILMDIPNRFFFNTNTSFKLIWLNIQTYVLFCILFFFPLIICFIRNQAWSSIFVPIFWGIGEIKFNDLMYLKCKSSFVFSLLNSNITFISKS